MCVCGWVSSVGKPSYCLNFLKETKTKKFRFLCCQLYCPYDNIVETKALFFGGVVGEFTTYVKGEY